MSTWVRCTATDPAKANWVKQPEGETSTWTKFVELEQFEIGETDERYQRLFGRSLLNLLSLLLAVTCPSS